MSGLSEILSNLSIVIPSVVILTSLAMLINIATSTENLPHVIHQSGCFTCVLSFLFFFSLQPHKEGITWILILHKKKQRFMQQHG